MIIATNRVSFVCNAGLTIKQIKRQKYVYEKMDVRNMFMRKSPSGSVTGIDLRLQAY